MVTSLFFTSRVVPTTSEVMASRCLRSRLKRELFPTFGRPKMATFFSVVIMIFFFVRLSVKANISLASGKHLFF
jgi:hypothetical protein